MAVAMINAKTTELDWDQVMQTPRGQVVPVYKATEAEWDAYVYSELQKLNSTSMEWIDGEIFIVERPSYEHDRFGLTFRWFITHDHPVMPFLLAHASPLYPGDRLPVQAPKPVIAPLTTVEFNSRLLLGLEPDAALSTQFPDALPIDLYKVLKEAGHDLGI
ncbi:hypothetical protein PHYSODRAFT_337587 [Phytophthora sojae]|uniref:Uncharacterized protein n=1 Tax=Phytophthora sojae (strain P6497) TaxID=1094619 RepID=G5A1L7_PHYSP|nr:hypothetical protein PHYSODRAFT_337587 [Phytophthora sojae]EGZ10815.1 hypothetical protein PHYSODRAFT_337587 [Phytophthora sojae]|eukprot:XP_009533560.1 hypothetical protein PHYSODRAFT_337587 [Phytophthora sojae]